jgi:hypothetical protein
MTLRIYPRRWSFEELTFIPDFNSLGMEYREFTVNAE